jgi:ribulose kinase
MVPGFWLSEGGQSATGALVDHILRNHGASAELAALGAATSRSPYEILNERLDELARASGRPRAELTHDLHVCPYFHGNRSPRADPSLRGMITGLTLSATLDDLARLYLATIQAIAYGTRHILEDMNRCGFRINTLFACGGGTRNPVFLEAHADITGCRLVLPREPEAVLLGSAILGAAASGALGSITDAMSAMSHAGAVRTPDPVTASYHTRKYRVFHELYEHQIFYRATMGTSS